MTLRLTDRETESLRKQAEAEGRSMQQVAKAAIEEYVARRSADDQIRQATEESVRTWAPLLRRLGE
ncbi:ribbon-helix-helix protein, CopG family [Murinocardiopsis flavida]|nr:ribbon-helix-helix protein, CopG family [Murinocardiopsis flavida]